MVAKFKALDKDGSGKLDVAEATEGMKESNLGEKEMEFFLNSSIGEDGMIDIGQFATLLFKLKVYDESQDGPRTRNFSRSIRAPRFFIFIIKAKSDVSL